MPPAAPALPQVPMEVPGVGTVMWHRGKGAMVAVDIMALPFRLAMEWSPKSGGKNFAGLHTVSSLEAFIQWRGRQGASLPVRDELGPGQPLPGAAVRPRSRLAADHMQDRNPKQGRESAASSKCGCREQWRPWFPHC